MKTPLNLFFHLFHIHVFASEYVSLPIQDDTLNIVKHNSPKFTSIFFLILKRRKEAQMNNTKWPKILCILSKWTWVQASFDPREWTFEAYVGPNNRTKKTQPQRQIRTLRIHALNLLGFPFIWPFSHRIRGQRI